MAIIILTLSMGLVGPQGGFGVVQGQTSQYPLVILLNNVERVLFATHTSSKEDGNWIELGGGTSVKLPSLNFVYEGPDIDYTKDMITVKMESDFIHGVIYPLSTHRVYTAGQTVYSTFWGSTDLGGQSVSFMLLHVSSLLEIRDVLDEGFLGIIDTLFDSLVWMNAVGLNSEGDGAHSFTAPAAGDYLLVVAKIINFKFYVYSATAIEVVDDTLTVSAPSSVEKGDPVNVNSKLASEPTGSYIHAAVLIKESAYSGVIKITTDGTIPVTQLYINGALMADGSLFTDFFTGAKGQFDLTTDLIEEKLMTAFDTDELVFDHTTATHTGSMSLSTSSLPTGDYILLVGVWKDFETRIAGVYQKKVTILKPYVPSPPPYYPPSPTNRPPVAEAGPNQTVYVGDMTHFSGVGSYDPDGTIVYYKWDLGDGTTASGMNVSHAYSEPGIYTAMLTVGDDRMVYGYDNCTITVLETIPPPPLPPILSDLTITPPELERGDNVTISLDIENIDSQSFTYIVTMHIENVNDPPPTWPPYHLTLLVDVDLGVYESKTVSRTITMDAVGDFNVTVDGLTGSFKVGTWPPEPPLKPAEFVVSDLTIEPEEVELWEGIDVWTFKVTVDVTNIGEQEGTHTVDLKVDGLDVDWRMVKLGGGESTPIIFDVTRGVGSYAVEVDGLTGSFVVKPYLIPLRPAEFEVSDLILSPSEPEPGGTVIVSAKITNIGETEGSYTLELKFDGETVETESVTLAGGTSQEIRFTISSEEEGIHTVEVEELSGSFTVKSLPPKKPIWPPIILAVAAVVVLIGLIWIRTDWIQQLIKRMGIDGDVHQELP